MVKSVSQGIHWLLTESLSLLLQWNVASLPQSSLQCSSGSLVCARTALRCRFGENADAAVNDCSRTQSWKKEKKIHTTIIGSGGSRPDFCGQSTTRRVKVVETVPRILLFSSSLMFPLSAGLSCSFVDPSFFPFSGTWSILSRIRSGWGENFCVCCLRYISFPFVLISVKHSDTDPVH